MGVGSWLSRFVGRGLVARFVLDRAAGRPGRRLLVGDRCSSPSPTPTRSGCCSTCSCFVVGTLVGLEIPLLMRLLRDRFEFKDVVANVLTFDYLGALGASLLFPIVLVPQLGLVRSPLLFGAINAARRAVDDVRCCARRWPGARRRLQVAVRRRAGAARRRHCWRANASSTRRRQPVRRRDRPVAHHALPAHRAHGVEGRPAAVPQREPAVQLARRVPLPRGARASRARGAAGSARAC